MSYKLRYILLLSPIFILHVIAQQSSPKKPFIGTLNGDGHNCYGKFTVTEKWLTWNARFDKCIRVPYTVVKQKQEGKHIFIEFRIPADAKCPFHFLTMEQGAEDSRAQLGWEVRGFASESGLKSDRDDLDCLLY